MSGWIKRLRQKLRNRRPALVLASILVFLLLTVSLTWFAVNEIDTTNNSDEAREVLAPQKWQVVIQKKYIAGPMVEEKQEYSTEELEEIVTIFSNMEMVEQGTDYLVFVQEIDDLSPVLKESGFFALDHSGMLHLYQGEAKDENIIQTFFQLDMGRLETTLPVEEYMQLREGIHISSLAEYNSVLSTYSEYAMLNTDEQDIEEH